MKRIRWPALVVAGVVVAGSGTAYAVSSDGTTGSYRTVAARKGDVEQVLSTTGTVDAARRADLEFGTSGTVASVEVALGDAVRAGQVIATLDTGALRAAVTRARASLARAEAQLEADEDAQQQAVSDAASGPQQGKPANGPSSGAPSSGVDPATTAALHAQQEAVIAAQSAATAAIAAAKSALEAQTAACADAYQDAPADPGGDGQAADVDPTKATAAADNAACSAALAEVQARQDDVSAAQAKLGDALAALASTLSKALATLGAPSARAGAPAASSAPSSTGADTPSAASDAPTSGASSAARLATDQASIEQARADLVDARQQLRQAVLRSTRSGRIAALDLAKGDDVSAGSTVATVVGGTAVTVEATVAESKIDQVKVGEKVRVATAGESDTAEGTVTAIGLVADTSSGTASYPVTVTVEDPAIALPTGSQAMLAIVVATAKDVVVVPTSAITRRDDSAYVRTWDGRTLDRKVVTLGAVGARDVEIAKGLSAGDEVVLADLDQAITGAADTINDRGGFNGPPMMRFDKGGGPGSGPVTFKSGG